MRDISFFFPEHRVVFDIEKMNRDILERDRNFYDALESSKWQPVEQFL